MKNSPTLAYVRGVGFHDLVASQRGMNTRNDGWRCVARQPNETDELLFDQVCPVLSPFGVLDALVKERSLTKQRARMR